MQFFYVPGCIKYMYLLARKYTNYCRIPPYLNYRGSWLLPVSIFLSGIVFASLPFPRPFFEFRSSSSMASLQDGEGCPALSYWRTKIFIGRCAGEDASTLLSAFSCLTLTLRHSGTRDSARIFWWLHLLSPQPAAKVVRMHLSPRSSLC